MLSRAAIRALFESLDEELARRDVRGEVYVVGGAVMTLVLDARDSTRDVDALFRPAKELREAAARVALEHGVEPNWLNDAVKGFLSDKDAFEPYLDLPHLKVMTAIPEYLLAMKCLSMRIGPEFHDEDDVRFLLRALNVESYEQALEIIARYYPLERFPPKTRFALEEILKGQ